MQVKSQPEQLQNYLTDASNMAGGYAGKLFLPESAEEIAQILREANESKTPVTISGARTGTVGGAIPFGGIIISLEKFNSLTWGYQAGIGADFGKIAIDIRYEGNFNKYGDHINISGKPYNFDKKSSRFLVAMAIAF